MMTLKRAVLNDKLKTFSKKLMNLNLHSCFVYGQHCLSNFTQLAMLFKVHDYIDHMYKPAQFTSALCFRHTRKF